jgi:Signal transduction histidine kinase
MIDLFCLPLSVIYIMMNTVMISAVMLVITMVFMYTRFRRDQDLSFVVAGVVTEIFLVSEVWICCVIMNQTLYRNNIIDSYSFLLWTAAAVSALWMLAGYRTKNKEYILPAVLLLSVMPPLANAGAVYYCTAFIVTNILLTACFVYSSIREINYYRLNINRLSIKEGIDMMTDGLAFDDSRGKRILVNRSMDNVLIRLGDEDHEKIKTRKGFIARFEHDTWEFSDTELVINKKKYIQHLAADITEEDALNRNLEHYNESLRQMNEHLQWMADNVEKIREEEEILAMKSKVHDILGQRLSIVHQVIVNSGEGLIDAAELRPMLIGMTDDIREDGKMDESDHLREIVEAFSFSGMQIILYGHLTGNEDTDAVIVRMIREAATNALRHAGAKKLFVFIKSSGSSAEVRITNDGARPEDNIKEGSGLQGIRRRVNEAGGVFEVISSPVFMLKAVFKY